MAKRILLGLAVAGLMVGGLAWLNPSQAGEPEAPADVKKDVGAAALVPANASGFSSALHIARRWKAVWESNAVQSLVQLPLVQQFWQDAQRHPAFQGLTQAVQGDPGLSEALPVLLDAISNEVFVCTGPDLPEFVQGAGAVVNKLRAWSLRNLFVGKPPLGREARAFVPGLVDAALENQERLRMPSLLVGFKLTSRDAARFLDTWVARIGPTPLDRIEKRTINGGEFHVLELRGGSIPPQALEGMARSLVLEGVAEEKSVQFLAWLTSQRIALAAGVLGDYLLLSIGKDTSLLEQWGKGACLADSPDLEPLRANRKPGLIGLSYTSAALIRQFMWTPDDVRRLAEIVIEAIPERADAAELKKRLKSDVALLAAELEAPKVACSLAFAFENDGVESFEFGGPPGGALDYSRPLSILAHRGRRPIAFSANRASKSPGSYDKAVKWLKVAFGYFEDFAVPKLEPADRQRYDKLMGLARPFLTSFHEATRDCLVPAIDGTQSLWVLDGRGVLAQLPDGPKLPQPLPIPRIAIAVELNDPEKLVQAFERYADAARKLLDAARKEYPTEVSAGLTLPPPQVADIRGAKLYYYPLPWDLGFDAFPCALLKDKLLILATSARLAEEMATPVPMPACPVVALDQPAGAVSAVQCGELWDLFRRATGPVFALLEQNVGFGGFGREGRPMALVVRMHLDALWRSLGAFRGYTSTATMREGRTVGHSWLHVEDIGP